MVFLYPVSDFLSYPIPSTEPNYFYQGYSPQTRELLKLPRTPFVEAIAHSLMQRLQEDDIYGREGKMYGVLLVELPNGEQRVIKAFSGLLNGRSVVEGWVSPIPGREEVALAETRTLTELEAMKQEIITLQQIPERQHYLTLYAEFAQKLEEMNLRDRSTKNQRHQKRQQLGENLTPEILAQLEAESRQEGIERRNLKRLKNQILQPLQQIITDADQRISELKQRRKQLSRQLQAQMHAAYSLTNFAGQSLSLQQLLPGGTPTGTGDCCAPKLLHYAASNQLKPLAMAEFWWGDSSGDKIQGDFYGACIERCQPLMGFLLSGLKPDINSLPIIYQDEWLIAVNKPPGLLSVPGRYSHNQDSVLSRLRLMYGEEIRAVHRLDQETSGILLLARDFSTYSHLSQQFQNRQIQKTYEALLAGSLTTNNGVIDLPLWGNPENRPYQQINIEKGKPSVTHFRLMAQEGNYSRVEFTPITGRTHQLRVHASEGLGIAILGDKLYGCSAVASRLHLHAKELSFQHPQSGNNLNLKLNTPF
ncbi:pseudouridine synthase [Cronbergia sp. UHCC 0137]|uniref:RluA family pseudouridine synthase n=1 Tax=Cronbergia sp. UHCC 0137 TaxID=3110239 RepID=UPI002B1EC345|nr:pseudouridine synthase [Cronbergia sp. UHCC 0137]MEA5617239.1 pseudouridine synthase [Cronbergia sp. UHCC 0137]